MRLLVPCLFATVAFAQSSPFSDYTESRPNRGMSDNQRPQVPRANVVVDADQVQVIVRIEVKASNRSKAEAGLRDFSAKLSARCEDKEELELERIEYTFASAYGKDRSSSFLGTKDKDSEVYSATGAWAVRSSVGDDAVASVDTLRSTTADLVESADNKEGLISITVSEANWRLSNPQDYRNELLHSIRRDAAEATKHLPMGENKLEIIGLDRPVQVWPQGSGKFTLFIPYSFNHKSQVTEDDTACGCEGGDEEHDEGCGCEGEDEQPAETK
jgi:hypothetical protein